MDAKITMDFKKFEKEMMEFLDFEMVRLQDEANFDLVQAFMLSSSYAKIMTILRGLFLEGEEGFERNLIAMKELREFDDDEEEGAMLS